METDVGQSVFPSRVALGANFCNRVVEKKRIQNNIKSVQHTLIVSPRRYGKTSLVCKTIEEMQVAFGYVHFFNAFRDEIVLKRFIEGLSQLLTKLLPKAKGAVSKFAEMIRHAKVAVNVVGIKAEVTLHPISKSVVDIVKGLLEDVDTILRESGRRAVLFCDEFQDIVESDSSAELQAVIRDFAQFTQHVTLIVSGSHRHMLLKIFNDSNKPFYKLFDRIDLHRISSNDYIPFIQTLMSKKWKEKISSDLIQTILDLTECHAYYVNRLCFKLWSHEDPPTFSSIHQLWQQLVEEEFGAIANDLSALTKNQRIVLQTICKNSHVREPTSDFFLKQVGLSPRSVSLAIQNLEKTDHIEHVQEGYRAIDPVTKHVLSK